MAIVFNNRRIVHPGAYDETKTGNIITSYTEGQRVPVILGQAETGESGKLKWFDDPDLARKYLTGGDLYDCIDLCFSPSPEGGGGCSKIGVIVTNKTKPSKLTSGGLEVNSIVHGQVANKISFELTEGTTEGTKKAIIQRWDTDTTEVIDNIGGIFDISYKGAKTYSSATITFSGSGDSKTGKLTLKSGTAKGSTTVDAEIDLSPSRFRTASDLASYINSISGYSVVITDVKSSRIPVLGLDTLVETEIPKSGKLTIKGISADIINKINTISELVTVKVTGSVENMSRQYLTGGTVGENPVSWSEYFPILKKNYCKVMVIATDSIAIQSEAIVFIGQMENRGIKMTMFTGGAIGETPEQCKKRATILNSSRAYVAYPEGVAMIKQGQSKLVPSYVVAAMIAGRKCGVKASESITFNYFNLVELGIDLMAGDTEVDELIEAGVCVLERVQNNGIRLAQAVSTYIGDTNENIIQKEMSVKMGSDDLSDRIRTKLEKMFIGGTRSGDSLGIESSIAVATLDELEQAKKEGEIIDYKEDVAVTRKGTAYYVQYYATISVPTNFLLITSNFSAE